MKMRVLLWKLHRWIGLACFLPFLILSVTGLILLILPAWPGAGMVGASSPIIPTGVDIAIAEGQSHMPGATPGIIMPGTAPDAVWTMAMAGGKHPPSTLSFNPHNGQILAITRSGTSLRDVVLTIHNSLLLGMPGKLVMLTTSLGLFMLGITGFSIMRQRLRTLRRSPLHGNYPVMSLHKWSGLVGLIFLMLLTITGFMLLSFKMLGDARPSGGRPPKMRPVAETKQPMPSPAPAAFSIANISRKALYLRPGTEIQAIMPGRGGTGPVAIILLDRGAAPWAKSSTTMFDPQTAAPMPPRPVPTFMQVMIAAKSLHTGLWDGRIIRALYIGCTGICLILGISGLMLWAQRRRQRTNPRPRTHRKPSPYQRQPSGTMPS